MILVRYSVTLLVGIVHRVHRGASTGADCCNEEYGPDNSVKSDARLLLLEASTV